MSSPQPPALPSAASSPSRSTAADLTPGERLASQLAVVTAGLIVVWTVAVVSFSGSAGTVAYATVTTFGLIYPTHLIMAGLAIWNRRTRQAPRSMTISIIAGPWLLLPLPYVLKTAAGGGPLLNSPAEIINTTVALFALTLVVVVARPRRAADLLPRFLLRSPTLNGLVVLGLVALYLLPLGYLAFHAAELQAAMERDKDGYLLVYGLGGLGVYLSLCTFPALLIAGYSGLSLFLSSFAQTRRWRIAQLIVALPLVLVGGGMLARAWWLSL